MNKKELAREYIPAGATIEESGNTLAWKVGAADIAAAASKLYHEQGLPLKLITAVDDRASSGAFKIFYIFGIPGEDVFLAPYIAASTSFPSLAPHIAEASGYERKIMTFFGLTPEGHPEPRTILLHENWPHDIYPLRKDFNWRERPKIGHTPFAFHKVEGEGIYELPVGPVHAGIIEPGHFRFNLLGEEIRLLEGRLGYSHKGSEKLFEVLPMHEKVRLSERISGDSSFSYSLAFCQALETLGGLEAPERARYLRVLFAELERLANHFGDIGAIMTDTGYNFGGAQGARLRERVMRAHERLTGSRFLRDVNEPGGVTKDIDAHNSEWIENECAALEKDFAEIIAIAEDSSTLLERLRGTGALACELAKEIGVTGVPLRALGVARDARADHPYAAYGTFGIEVSTAEGGDVLARFLVRVREVRASLRLLSEIVRALPAGAVRAGGVPLYRAHSLAVSVVEGWRGDIVCFVATDARGDIARVEFRDPSFLNWPAVGHAGKGNMVPDFPLINKSFNLSYSGNDL